jgi:hypothetical protein
MVDQQAAQQVCAILGHSWSVKVINHNLEIVCTVCGDKED